MANVSIGKVDFFFYFVGYSFMIMVFIVEDDFMNFWVFFKIFIKWGGFIVKGSEDVVEVLVLVWSKVVDVILIDVFLFCSYY